MLYLDTSLLVAAFTHESGTARALKFIEKRRQEPVGISAWVATEFSSALSIKIRTGEIDDTYRREALALFSETVAHSLEMIPVEVAHFWAAANFVGRHKLALRAADALHLAVARDRSATVCTLDKRMATASKALGIATRLV